MWTRALSERWAWAPSEKWAPSEVKEVGMGPIKEIKEVGMGPIKEVDIRERDADCRELLCLRKSGPSSLTMW